MTITPEADAVKPIPCSLPDPENAYTIDQVRESLIEMEAQLASYPVNLSRGPGWVRQQILSMLDRGIVPDKCEPTQISEGEELAIQRLAVAMVKIDELKHAMAETHCADCCCARSWKALGIDNYTGRSIPEHIEDLKRQVANYSDAYAMAENSIVGLEAQRVELLHHLEVLVGIGEMRGLAAISTVEDARALLSRIESEKP